MPPLDVTRAPPGIDGGLSVSNDIASMSHCQVISFTSSTDDARRADLHDAAEQSAVTSIQLLR